MEIRPYRGTDEAQLLAVWHRAMTHDRIDQAVFRTKVLLDPNFRPENLLVAVEADQVVGFVLAITRQVPLYLQGLEPQKSWITAFGVHPDFRHRGIGTALFKRVLERLKLDGRKTVEISPYVPNYFAPGVDSDKYTGTVGFLQNVFGFETIEKPISMGINLNNFQIPTEILELEQRRVREDDLIIRSVIGADLPELMPFIHENFGWDWYRHLQEYLVEYFGDSERQICFLVAVLKGKIVGFCGQRRERFGPFGVDASVRNLGIGRILLFRCLAEMSARQFYYTYFMWTEENAARLYTFAGFQKRREFAVLSKDLQ
ncbi:MAG: GNAT family N-acetyltransferase [Chloroflexota bacterium]